MSDQKQFNYKKHIYNTRSAAVIVPIILKMFNISSVLDVGCGLGTWLRVFQDHGVDDIVGVDAEYTDVNQLVIGNGKFIKTDLNKNFFLSRKFDLVISLEVAEHLRPESADVFVKSLTEHGDLIVFSAAIPRQGGAHHINEQWQEYWASIFNKFGYRVYDYIRPLCWDNADVDIWYKQNVLIFSKNNVNGFPPTSPILNIVHPELYELKIGSLSLRLNEVMEGKIGIKNSFTILGKAIKLKLRSLLNA